MSIYRKVVWYTKGLKEYTKGGYQTACKAFNPPDMEVDCTDKSYMITGANSGIGKVAALEVAKRGGTVHMVCRNEQRGKDAQEEIAKNSGSEKIHLHLLDMADPKGVTKFAEEFAQSGKTLDVLINNAGCMVNEREITTDGLEKNFATNTVGTHLLTTGLMPVLQQGNKPRVVIVTSGGMLVVKLDPKDLTFETMKPFDGTFAYAQNKRQQVVMTRKYAKKYTGVHFSCMHPGWADTPAVRMSMPDFYEKMKDKLRTAEEGADTMVWLAIAEPALSIEGGLFFQDRKPVPAHLPLAWTKSSDADEDLLMQRLDELADKFKC